MVTGGRKHYRESPMGSRGSQFGSFTASVVWCICKSDVVAAAVVIVVEVAGVVESSKSRSLPSW